MIQAIQGYCVGSNYSAGLNHSAGLKHHQNRIQGTNLNNKTDQVSFKADGCFTAVFGLIAGGFLAAWQAGQLDHIISVVSSWF